MMITIADPETRFFEVETEGGKGPSFRDGYFTGRSNVTLVQLLEPTRAIVGLFVIFFVLHGILQKSFGSFNKTELLMGGFSVILVTSVLLKSNVIGFNLRVASDAFIIPFLAYFISRRLITDEDRYRKLTRSISYMGFSVILICLPQHAMEDELSSRLRGPFSSDSALYVLLTVAFFIVLSDYFQRSAARERGRVVFLPVQRFVLCAAPLMIVLTWSRGAWVGFVIGLAAFMFLGWRLLKRSQALGLLGVALVFSAIIGIGMQELVEPLERRVGDTNTIYGRIATWTVAINSGLKEPILGIGLNNLREVLVKNTAEVEGFSNYPRVHNSFLQILSEQGVLGLLVYLTIIVTIIRFNIRLKRTCVDPIDKWRGITVIAIMTAYLVPAMFASTIHVSVPLTHVFVYVFCGAVAGRYGGSGSVLRGLDARRLASQNKVMSLAAK